MNILIDILHPAHVHFFKHFIKIAQKKGHEIFVTSREKEMTNYLLDVYEIDHLSISSIANSVLGLGKELFLRNLRFLRVAKKFKPGVFLGIMGPTIAPVGKLMGVPSLVFYDTEIARVTNSFVFPLATKVITPASYKNDRRKNQLCYNGYQELAYLHPNNFKPNKAVLSSLDLKKNETFFILRLVSWQASHDIGYNGLQSENINKLIKTLESYGRVFIISEKAGKNNHHKLDIPPEKIHDLLYYATAYIGEGATMATEAALLGTPSFYVSPQIGQFGNFDELEDKYDLLYSIENAESVITKMKSLLDENINLKKIWSEKRNRLLQDKIDVTQYIVDLVENEMYKKK